MADDIKENPTAALDFESTTAAIFKRFDDIKKWREINLQEFRKMQLLESEKYIRLSGESQKHFQQILESETKSPEHARIDKNPFPENYSPPSVSDKNSFENSDTLEESSITTHLQHCFNDSSQSSPSASENKINNDAQKKSIFTEVRRNEISERNVDENKVPVVKNVPANFSTKPKRQFLKKGAGLLRYMPKSATNRHAVRNQPLKSNNSQKRNPHLPQKSLKLKPAIRSAAFTSENAKHIRFDIPEDLDGTGDASQNLPKSVPSTVENIDSHQTNSGTLSSSSPPKHYVPEEEKLDSSISGNESLNMSKDELEEFEMLENFAQNSSFNSDSSVVQRVLHGEKSKKTEVPPNASTNGLSGKEAHETSFISSIFSPKIGLSKFLKEIHAINASRKKCIEQEISDLNPRILSLQKEISRPDAPLNDGGMGERCSTPVEDLCLKDRNPSSIPENDSSVSSLDFPAPVPENNCDSNRQNYYDIDGVPKDSYQNQNSLEVENLASAIPDLPLQNDQKAYERSQFHEKRLELEKEIKIYQEYNEKAKATCEQRDEVLRKLEKEREDFHKNKEAEKKKFEAQIEEERRQLRREKETFSRLQKLSKDNPTRKERDEINSLRQQLEKLQEELKRQKIKNASETRRFRNQLDAAEKDRDTYKLENIKLEEQVEDLIATLKVRMKKQPEARLVNKTDENNARPDKVAEKLPSGKCRVAENNVQEEQFEADLSKKSILISPRCVSEKKTKTKVRFNLASTPLVHQDDQLKSTETFSEKELNGPSKEEDYHPEIHEVPDHYENEAFPEEIETPDLNLSTIFESAEYESIEIGNDSKGTAPKELETPAVNLSIISVSVEAEFKEIDYGNRTERIYLNGEREIRFNTGNKKLISADGKTIKYFFYNGDSKEIYPDKREFYKYVNGITQTKFPDGSEETEYPSGQVQRRYPDGRQESKFPDGTMFDKFADGSEKVHGSDGNVYHLSVDGTVTIEFTNGQKEIQTKEYKRREFPDGSVKIAYYNGRTETRYSDGRIRIKDKDGKTIVDTKYLPISKG